MAALTTKVLPKSLLNTVKRSPRAYSILRRARFGLGTLMGARTVPGIPGRCHFNDFMLDATDPKSVTIYQGGAENFVKILDRSIVAAGRNWSDIERCLEIGCGYGRIIRVLKDRLPADRIYVCDVIEEGARFTAEEFGANAIPLIENAGSRYDGSFDLIYLLSVYTHMRRERIQDHVERVARAMKTNGVLVFSIQGEVSASNCEQYELYWLDKERLNRSLAADGYYYARYPYYNEDYGVTWFRPDAVHELMRTAAPALQPVSYESASLDGHQDIYVYRKT